MLLKCSYMPSTTIPSRSILSHLSTFATRHLLGDRLSGRFLSGGYHSVTHDVHWLSARRGAQFAQVGECPPGPGSECECVQIDIVHLQVDLELCITLIFTTFIFRPTSLLGELSSCISFTSHALLAMYYLIREA